MAVEGLVDGSHQRCMPDFDLRRRAAPAIHARQFWFIKRDGECRSVRGARFLRGLRQNDRSRLDRQRPPR
jgi:hypothetical protein